MVERVPGSEKPVNEPGGQIEVDVFIDEDDYYFQSPDNYRYKYIGIDDWIKLREQRAVQEAFQQNQSYKDPSLG